MNKKKTSFGKLVSRVAVILALFCVLAMVMTSCGSNNGIQQKPLSDWAGTDVETNGTETETNPETNETGSETGSETTDESETADNAESETEGETETGDGAVAGTGKNPVKVKEELGFIDKILSYIGIFLSWITTIMPAHSYLLTLCVFAIIFEIVFLPFSIAQQKNSIKQAKLRPKEMAIRKRYAGRNDQATQQKVTQEIQELYQKENFNPMSGCLPLLLQLPIILVLYSVVVNPIKHVMGYSSDFSSFMYAYLQQNGISVSTTNGSVELLSKIVDAPMEVFDNIGKYCSNPAEVMEAIEQIKTTAPNFSIGPVNFGLTPAFDFSSANGFLLFIPVLTFVVYFLSMKINRKLTAQPTANENDRQAACSNKMMDYTMPLMSVWMTFIVPGAVGVYWMFKSVIGMLKQFIMSKIMPLPKFTEEDYKAAEKEMLGKQPKKIQKSENAGKVRSLHHIDDEDYDEKGNYIGSPEPKKEEPAEEKADSAEEQLPDNNMTKGATLKDESDKGEKKSLFGKKDK